jgi:ATP-dependent Lon protease
MSSFGHLSFSSEQFTGRVRIFPLPNLVLFPHVMQPLHIFEPRYRALLEDALTGDHLIAMALLAPGWESNYEGRPPLCPMACLGKVATSHRLADDTYNLLVLGVKRVRLLDELDPARSYREAQAQLCEDRYPESAATKGRNLHQALRDAFVRTLPSVPEVHEQIEQLLGSDVPLGVLTDVIGFMLDIEVAHKEALLAEVNVYRRAEMLLEHLVKHSEGAMAGSPRKFPPEFSAN